METLSATEPHYIRCVKPNNILKPAIFENFNIIQQLRCGVSIICFKAFLSSDQSLEVYIFKQNFRVYLSNKLIMLASYD
jgi:hypothetical protein